MNILIRLLTIIVAVSISHIALASEITDTYSTGDTLTATTLNNIKSAVNDNDSNITTNTSAIGSLFYGDGSAGDLTVSSFVNWQSTPPTNVSFDNVTIEAGQSLSVPAGTTIRCSGTFTNNGTINVFSFGGNSSNWSTGSTAHTVGYRTEAHQGDAFRPAAKGSFDNTEGGTQRILYSGRGGIGIPEVVTSGSWKGFRFGGGAGAGWSGGGGGGLLKILCNGAISNTGTISALGSSGSAATGGGGGGIVILASTTSVDNSFGTINVPGGTGGSSISYGGTGGGGGGGIIILTAPTINSVGGTTDVTGGAAGSNSSSVSSGGRTAGGGGGASGGNGGSGGGVTSTGTADLANQGLDGYVLEILANPAYM